MADEITFDLDLQETITALQEEFGDPRLVIETLRGIPQFSQQVDSALQIGFDQTDSDKKLEEFRKFSQPSGQGFVGDVVESGLRALNPMPSLRVIQDKLSKLGVREEDGEVVVGNLQADPDFVLAVTDLLGTLLPVLRGTKVGLGALKTLGFGGAVKKGAETGARQFAADTGAALAAGGAVGGAISRGIDDRMALAVIGLLGGGTGAVGASRVADIRPPKRITGPEDIEFTKAQLRAGTPGAERLAQREEGLARSPVGSEKAEEFFTRQSRQAEEATEASLRKGFGEETLGQELREGKFDPIRTAGELPESVRAVRSKVGEELAAVRDPAIEAAGTVKNLGKDTVSKLDKILKENDVSFDKKGNPVPLGRFNDTGLSAEAANTIIELRGTMAEVKTLKQLSNKLKAFDREITKLTKSGDLGDTNAPLLLETRAAIKGKIDAVLKKQPTGESVIEARKAFSEIAAPTERINNLITQRDATGRRIPKNSEQFAKDFFRNKTQATLADDLIKIGKQDPEVLKNSRLAMIQEIFGKTKKTADASVNARLLDELWNSNTKGAFKQGVKEKLFTPEQIKTMDEMVDLFNKVGPRKAAIAAGGSATQGRQVIASRFGSAWGWLGSIADFAFVRKRARNVFRDFKIAPETSGVQATVAGTARELKETKRARREDQLRRLLRPKNGRRILVNGEGDQANGF